MRNVGTAARFGFIELTVTGSTAHCETVRDIVALQCAVLPRYRPFVDAHWASVRAYADFRKRALAA